MIFKQKITIFAVIGAFFWLSSTVIGQDKIDTDISPSKPSPQAAQSKDELPEIAGWKKTDAMNTTGPDGQYIVHYDSEKGGRVTVYIYTRGLSSVPDGAENDVVKDEMNGAKGAIKQVAEAGIYSDVKIEKDEVVTLGGKNGKVKALHSNVSFKARGTQLISETFLFGNRNKIVKIRASRPKEIEESGRPVLEGLFGELDVFFSK